MVRFVRVSENVVFGLTSKEDDLLNRRRSTKKIKEDLKTYMDGVSISFADKLLQLVGGSEVPIEMDLGVHKDVIEEVPKENDCHGTQTMDGPVIPLFDVELLHWSSTWLNTLVVNVLGKRVNFRILETKVQRDWERKGTIQIIDLHDGYYQIVFSKEYSCVDQNTTSSH